MARSLIDVWREGGDAWLAVVFHPKDRLSGAMRTLLFTDAPALYTTDEETPPNARFEPRLTPSWRLKRSLAVSGAYTGPSAIESANFEINNSDGSLTFLKFLVWSDQPFEVYMGSPRGPAGAVLHFSEFLPLVSGVTQECRGTSVLSIAASGRKASLNNPLVQEFFRGFGMGVLVPDDGTSQLAGPASEDHNVTGALTIEWIGRLTGSRTGADPAPLYAVSNFYGLVVDDSGNLGFVTGASEDDTSSTVFSDYVPPAGVDVYLAGVVEPDGVSVSLYAREWLTTTDGFRPGTLLQVGSLTMPVALSKTNPALGTPLVGRKGTSSVGVHAYEIRVLDRALAYDEMLAGSERSLPALGAGVSGLLDAWRFAEGEGETALSEVNRVDLTLSGDASWRPSLDGDDPVVFATSLPGQTKPGHWGPCFHFPLVLLDTQTRTYGWRGPDLGSAASPSSDLRGLRANGAPLVPDETISLGDGSVSFGFDDEHVISLSGLDAVTGLAMTAKRLVPGQLAPARDGQRITVSGTPSHDGTYTIAPDGLGGQPAISPDGRDIRVVESMASETVLSPAPVVIRTIEAERQFTYDLGTSTAVILSDEQAGPFGIDASGGEELAYAASELFALVSGGVVNADGLLWDPLQALGHVLNSQTTRKAALDGIALSAMAWWIEDEEGVFRLITIRPPVGEPTRRFRSEIKTVRSLPSTDPFSRISVAHSRNYLVLQEGSIPGSVPPDMRSRLNRDYLLAPRSATATTLKNFPQSKPRTEPFPTYLTSAADAERWLDLATPVFLEERLWWEVAVAGAWAALAVRPGDEIEIVYEPPTGAFETGATARVMSVAVDKSSDETVLEVVT